MTRLEEIGGGDEDGSLDDRDQKEKPQPRVQFTRLFFVQVPSTCGERCGIGDGAAGAVVRSSAELSPNHRLRL
jgi:hypothetical protein